MEKGRGGCVCTTRRGSLPEFSAWKVESSAVLTLSNSPLHLVKVMSRESTPPFTALPKHQADT